MDSLDTNPTGRCIQIVCWIQSEALKGDVFPTRQAFGSMITRNKSSIYVIDLRWSWELIKWWVFCLWTLELLWWNKELITKAWRTETRNCSTASLQRFDRWALFCAIINLFQVSFEFEVRHGSGVAFSISFHHPAQGKISLARWD